jgi:hypothetical protein
MRMKAQSWSSLGFTMQNLSYSCKITAPNIKADVFFVLEAKESWYVGRKKTNNQT